MKEEVWKPIVGYEGIYEVSSFGRVKSLERIVIRSNGIQQFVKSRILSPGLIKGYPSVGLKPRSKNTNVLVHRLVATAFLKNEENKPFVNHINGVKTDNRVENLEWCTVSENTKHAYSIGLKTPPHLGKFGVNHHNSKKVGKFDSLTDELLDTFISVSEAATSVGISVGGIGNVLTGRSKTCKGFKWKYI